MYKRQGQSPFWVKLLVILADLAVLAIVLGFLVMLFGRKRKEKRAALWVNVLLFTGFIALNVASASVTIRVELRWIYVSLAGALLFLAWMYGELTNGVKKELYLKRIWPWGVLFGAYEMCIRDRRMPVLWFRSRKPLRYRNFICRFIMPCA